MHKFSMNIIFAKSWIFGLRLFVISRCVPYTFYYFKDLIFVDDKLPVKTPKIISLENLYQYGIHKIHT